MSELQTFKALSHTFLSTQISRDIEWHQLQEFFPEKMLSITSVRTDPLAFGVTETDRSINS